MLLGILETLQNWFEAIWTKFAKFIKEIRKQKKKKKKERKKYKRGPGNDSAQQPKWPAAQEANRTDTRCPSLSLSLSLADLWDPHISVTSSSSSVRKSRR
jgi:hypothetical protein